MRLVLVTSTESPPTTGGFWPLDGTIVDEQMGSNGVTVNSPNFISPGITGRCCALQLNMSANQSVQIDGTRHLNLSFQSFTFQFWIYPYSLDPYGGDRGMMGQCQITSINQCLHMTLRGNAVRISFFGNPCNGVRNISPFRWYHLTFVYDLSLSTQFTYIDGTPECNHTSSMPLAINSSTPIPLTIGVTYPLAPFFFDGLIDQVSLYGYAKNATEILEDATLVIHYSFDADSLEDLGPNKMIATMNNASFSNGSLSFNGTRASIQISSFVLLGTTSLPFSFSLWIKPAVTNGGTIVHASLSSSSNGGQWCLPFLGFTSSNRVAAQTRSANGTVSVTGPPIAALKWVHLAQTYSPANGLSLYINGSLYNRTTPFDSISSGTPLILTIGNSLPDGNKTACSNVNIETGQFYGSIDDVRVFSRELTPNDVKYLSNK